jgi:hypothetical protein
MRAVPTGIVPKTTRTRLALSLAIGRFCRCRRAGSAASGLSRLCACLDGEKLSEVCCGKIRRLCGFCGVLMVHGLEARKSNRPRCLRRLRAIERGRRDGKTLVALSRVGASSVQHGMPLAIDWEPSLVLTRGCHWLLASQCSPGPVSRPVRSTGWQAASGTQKAATVGREPEPQHNSQGIQPPSHEHRDRRSWLYVKRQPH